VALVCWLALPLEVGTLITGILRVVGTEVLKFLVVVGSPTVMTEVWNGIEVLTAGLALEVGLITIG
jgi:hypothetical protein